MPMRAAGNSRWKSFVIGSLSGVVEPVGAVAVLLLASLLLPVLPYMLAFAAGAMLYVVVEELIPEASAGQHSNLSTIGFAVGFVLMMVLDVVMGVTVRCRTTFILFLLSLQAVKMLAAEHVGFRKNA